jgi:hypothetical protein
MFAENINEDCSPKEHDEFDFYMQFAWPEHIETALRRLLWISLVEEAESFAETHSHTTFLRFMMATYPETPAEVLEYLSSFDDCELLIRIAENPQTPPRTLQTLAAHENSEVRLAVADNKETPLPILLQMLGGADVDIRYRMAENPALPAKMLNQLTEDENAYVASRARRTLMRRNPPSIQQLPLPMAHEPPERKAM